MSDDKRVTTTQLRQERFAREYVLDHNATRAYKAAGYTAKNDDVAKACASRLLANANVQQLIHSLEAKVHEELGISKERIEAEIAAIAFIRAADFYDEEGGIKPPQEWTPEMRAAVASVEVVEIESGKGEERTVIGHTRKVKLWPKLDALLALGAAHGIGVKKVEVGRPGDFSDDEETLRRRILDRSRRLRRALHEKVINPLPAPAGK